MLIAAPGAIEAPLVAERLRRWGAQVEVATGEANADAMLSARAWDAIVVDRALGAEAAHRLARAGSAARRIVLLTPAERHELPDLKTAGFTGYLVKPVRVASLAARFTATETADVAMADEASGKTLDAPRAGLACWSPRTTTSTHCSPAPCCTGLATARPWSPMEPRRSMPSWLPPMRARLTISC